MHIDIASQIAAVDRRVENREHEGRPARVVVATRTYAAPVDDVWDAVTNPDRIPRWFLPVSGDLRLGGRYQLEGNASGTITGCEPPRHLALTWEFGGEVTWVEVRLEEDPGGTRLQLEHAAHDDERWGEFGPGAVGVGWDMALLGLDQHLATGAAVEGASAWMESAEGKAFMRGSSDEWGRAAVASGTPEDAALAAAARTSAAYAGD
ncbi:MAG TPA: SRPBCC family protein [Acidimicrobiales bacterium]|nr:SRPBCC family protein [Acidimicrobiales bacterium]